MLAGATALAALVFALLALSFRRRERTVSDRTWIVGLGLAMPVAVLGALLVYALVVGSSLLPTPAPDGVRVEVVAKRYGWAFRTPSGRVSQGVLHLPAGRPVDLAITSTDVIHSLWIPRLAGKMDAMPGHVNVLRVEASQPGAYRGECAEYCGTGHKEHGFRVIAHDPAGWAAFEGAAR
jgi:heme/copper-type cytochrome/quinol oxidase subunit 2